jgi:hypothetical protein
MTKDGKYAYGTLAAGTRHYPRLRAKYLLFAVLGLMFVYVLIHDEISW